MEIKTGKGTIPLVVLLAIWSVSAISSLPGLAVSPVLGDLNRIFPKATDLEIQMLTSLPSLLIIMLVATVSSRMQENKTVKAVMRGIHPAVVGLIAAAALSIGKTALFPMGLAAGISLSSLALALLCLFSIKKCGLNPVVAIVASGVAGIFLFGGI